MQRFAMIGLGLLVVWPACLPGQEKAAQPVVAAQLYIWTQHYSKQKQRMEDHLDEVFAATRRAGYDAVQGWLNFYSSAESTEKTAGLLKKHGLTMPAAYAGGIMHTKDGGQKTIDLILQQAKRGAGHGLNLVVHNPNPKLDKTADELAITADNLNRLGEELAKIGVKLGIHQHAPEMRNGAKEWYHILRNTDPKKVGFCLDLDWVQRGQQDPYRLLEDTRGRLYDLHLRNGRDGIWWEDLDTGDIDYARVAKILAKMGYQGSYTVELAYEAKTPVTRSLEENLKRSRGFVRKVFGW